MRGMPFNLQGKGVLEVAEAGETGEGGVFWVGVGTKRKKGIKEGLEPRSVLDNRRSPSPPTSSSTLSSSLGGGGGSSDTAGVAAVSDNPTHKWPPSDSTSAAEEGGLRKEEWASELQPIMGLAGGDKCGLGVEDLETMLSQSAGSPGQEQTFLRWIMGDIDDPSGVGGLKQQVLSHGPVEFDGNGLGFGLVDPDFGFAAIGGAGGVGGSGGGSISMGSPAPVSTVSSGGGFPQLNSNGNRIPPSQSAMPGFKVPCFGNQANNHIFSMPPANSLPLPLSLPPGMFYQESMEEKSQLFGPSLLLNQHQQAHVSPNPAFFLPLPPPYTAQPEHQHQHQPQLLLPPQPKRHQPIGLDPIQIPPKLAFPDPGSQDLFLLRNQPQQQLHGLPFHLQPRQMKPKDEATAAHQQQQQQALVDQLFKAAELIEAGNFVSAHGILARLNHQLHSPIGKPLLRSAFYFKEALLLLTNTSNPSPSSSPPQQRNPFSAPPASPYDVVLKIMAYKAFLEISPVLQFTNFTCIQAFLEELNGSNCIHIVDFDIGFDGQWASFMRELADQRCAAAATPLLKITAFASPSSHSPFELHLTGEHLSQFANDLNIPFQFNVLNIDSFDPTALLSMSAVGGEAIAVNLPVGYAFHRSFPTLLRLVKQLSPKIVVSVDRGCDRTDLSFSHQFFHAFQSCTVLLDSIDAACNNPDAISKIERFLMQPVIESAMLGRHRAIDKMLPWRTLFASSGFMPIPFSNSTETQAECLLKRTQLRGFHVEKRNASLLLCWQRGELVSVSAWRC